MRQIVGLLASLAVSFWSVPASAEPAAPPAAKGVPLSALLSLNPAAVRRRLASVPAEWPEPPAFQISTPGGLLAFVTIGDLMIDPALAARMAAFRTHGDHIPSAPYLDCRELLTQGGGSPEIANTVVLMFRDGRLASAFRPVSPAAPHAPPTSDRKAWDAFLRRPPWTFDFRMSRPSDRARFGSARAAGASSESGSEARTSERPTTRSPSAAALRSQSHQPPA